MEGLELPGFWVSWSRFYGGSTGSGFQGEDSNTPKAATERGPEQPLPKARGIRKDGRKEPTFGAELWSYWGFGLRQ